MTTRMQVNRSNTQMVGVSGKFVHATRYTGSHTMCEVKLRFPYDSSVTAVQLEEAIAELTEARRELFPEVVTTT